LKPRIDFNKAVSLRLFDFPEEEFFRSWKGDANNPVIKTSNDYSTVPGVKPEFVAFNMPRKGYLVVTHLPDSSTCFFQFQSGFTAVRKIPGFGNIGASVLGPRTATGRGGEKKETEQNRQQRTRRSYLFSHNEPVTIV
jgi:hypothetical protein